MNSKFETYYKAMICKSGHLTTFDDSYGPCYSTQEFSSFEEFDSEEDALERVLSYQTAKPDYYECDESFDFCVMKFYR